MIIGKAKKPRISVNKLAEYLEAPSTRRKKIVYDSKYPQKFITTRYKDARSAAIEYLCNGRDEDILLNMIDVLEKKTPATDFQEQDFPLSIESLESLLDCELSILDGCELIIHDNENELIEIKKVDISVNPDLIVKKMIAGVVNVGAIKLHISKTNILPEESQKIVGVMLYQYADRFLKDHKEEANTKLCFSLDMFGKCIVGCPSSYKHRMRKIETACEEIALWWDTL